MTTSTNVDDYEDDNEDRLRYKKGWMDGWREGVLPRPGSFEFLRSSV